MNPGCWLRGGHFSSGAGAGLAYTEATRYGLSYAKECQDAMMEHLRLAAEYQEIGKKQQRRTESMNAYCKWWEKPLEEVEEDAQEVCLKEDRSCSVGCPYITEEGVAERD